MHRNFNIKAINNIVTVYFNPIYYIVEVIKYK